MSTLPVSKTMLHNNNFCKIGIDLIKKYTWANFEDLALFKVMKIDFELWTKESWETIDVITWMIIKQHCISYGIYINHYGNNGNQIKILIRLILTDYNANL